MAIEKALALIALKRTEQIGDISDAVEAAQAAQTAAETAQGKAEDAAELAEETVASKADIDGYYANMTVGNAEQLISDDYVTDQTPHIFRTAGGDADIGDREYDELVGGTIAWNQLVKSTAIMNDGSGQGLTWSIDTDGTVHFDGTSEGRVNLFLIDTGQVYKDHVYFIHGLGLNVHSSAWYVSPTSVYSNPLPEFMILKSTDTETALWLSCEVMNSGLTFNNVSGKFWICDLTAMFGTAIADYIYALEQATAGAGVAWFRNLFPLDYYQYNAGTLMSVNAASHDMVGFNQWDEEWELGALNTSTGVPVSSTTQIRSKNFIPAFPSTTYYNKGYTLDIYQYDADQNFISHISTPVGLFTTTADTHYLKFWRTATTYNNDICINLSWSGYRNGEYEPYEKNSYPLDSTLTLRGIPKLDASNNLYYDGDTYEADGTVTRRYESIDLGSLTWTADGASYPGMFRAVISGNNIKYRGNLVCPKYQCYQGSNELSQMPDKNMTVGNSQAMPFLRIKDTNYDDTQATEFKTSLSGVYLVYELATPTTETADAFQTPQIVNDFGTEQYVDAAVAAGTRDVAIPVGHTTKYIANLVDKLRRLPNAPDAVGNYLVHYDATTRRMSCTEYLDGSKVTALEGKVPDAPSVDGTYTLTATVADGEVTYSWEAQS